MIVVALLAAALHAAVEPTSPPSDAVVAKEMIGMWVSSDTPPSGDKATLCGTDESDWLLPRGRYEGLYDEGTWRIRHGVLIISVLRSNSASGGESPMKRLAKPEVRTLTIESVHNGLAKVRTARGPAWMFRCSVR